MEKTAEAPATTMPTTATTGDYLYPFISAESLKWGFLDETGSVVVEPKFQWAAMMIDGMARVKNNDLWGYVDSKGNTIVEPKYERARNFENGYGAVREAGKYGYLDRTGTMVVAPKYSKLAQGVSEGLIAVPDENKLFGFIDLKGDVVIPHKFTNAHAFSEGVAAAAEGEKWGIIDKAGNWVIAPHYVWADQFVEGHCLVRMGTQPNVEYALIDHGGTVKFKLQTLHVKTPSEGLILVQVGEKWGFTDYNGKMKIPANFDAAFDFHEGLAAVRIGNGWGYIDATGGLVLNVDFFVAEEFRGGLARVTWPGGKWGYVDQTGRAIWKSTLPSTPGGDAGDTES